MDKGLDIEALRCVLAFHAACTDSAAKLAALNNCFVTSRTTSTPARSLCRDVVRCARRLSLSLQWRRAEAALNWAANTACTIITAFEPDFPALLREIPAPPVVLFVKGQRDILDSPQLAIVGARKASFDGRRIARTMARTIGKHGITVTSGLATGIDAAAHHGALDVNSPTVAVFGCGIDRIYPAKHAALADRIAARGALVSEFPLGSAPRPYHFPRRNRLISGLSLGTVVVEAASRSGSISTAMHALEQGREVFAVPGSIRNPLSAGCHKLIKQGASLVDSVDDILVQLPIPRDPAPSTSHNGFRRSEIVAVDASEAERRILEVCAFEAQCFDTIVEAAALTPTEVSAILSALEVKGLLRSVAGNAYINIRP